MRIIDDDESTQINYVYDTKDIFNPGCRTTGKILLSMLTYI
jgi:hypothetical protein